MLTLEELLDIISQKIKSGDKNSYCYSLSDSGVEGITRKIGEEALEVVIASFVAKNNSEKSRQELVCEICDLFFHTLVLMSHQKISFDEVKNELTKRNVKK